MRRWWWAGPLLLAACAWAVGSSDGKDVASVAVATTEDVSARVERLLGSLTLDERIDQLLMSYPPINASAPVTVGGVIFVGNLLTSKDKVTARVRSLQSRSKVPLLVAADVEGGRMNRLGFLPELAALPSNLELARHGPQEARRWGLAVGQGMRALQINLALAPVLDLAGRGVMHEDGRTFGSDPELVARLGQAYVDGLQEAGVGAIGKHWPGYGDLGENTDHHFVVTERSAEEVQLQTRPFREVGAALSGVMLANVGFSSYGSVPAILSPALVADAHAAGWITMTDDLAIPMLTEATGGDAEEVVRRAFLAGNDILLTTAPVDWDKALDYHGVIRRLVDEDPAHEARVERSVRRILTVKARLGLL
jgi:beta-N-acetylhexosaminidase